VKQQDLKEVALLLQQCIVDGEEDKFKNILTKQLVSLYNSDIDTLFRFQEKMTLTHLAARYDRVEVLMHLYEELGAFLESHDGNGATPLFYAIANNCTKGTLTMRLSVQPSDQVIDQQEI